jgi:hypothetical protein
MPLFILYSHFTPVYFINYYLRPGFKIVKNEMNKAIST